MKIRSSLILTNLFLCSVALMGQAIVIPDHVQVQSETLLLGDLVEGLAPEIAAIAIGYAPYAGHHRWLTQEDLRRRIRQAGFEGDLKLQIPDRILITRDSQRLQNLAIEEAVFLYLSQTYPMLEIELLECEVPREILLPLGNVRVAIESQRVPVRLDGVSLKLNVFVDGRHARSQWVRVRARATGQVVSAARDIPFGSTLHRTDLVVQRRELSQLEDFVADLEQVRGAVTKKALAEGSVIRRRDVAEPVLVKRGEVVRLVAQGPALRVSTTARARDSGGYGDSITVQNISSKQLIRATVVGLNTVKVSAPGGTR